jgi:XRE family transcriptional regulator, fatty acid utilization regulator
LTMLRSYQELHDNYFADIETEADRFLAEFAAHQTNTNGEQLVTDALLTNLLKTRHSIHLQDFEPAKRPELAPMRAIYKPNSPATTAGILYLNASLAPAQRLFVLAREVGFLHLNAKTRSKTYPPTETESFEQVLTNARASYFAGAVLIRRDALIEATTQFFAQPDWDNNRFLALIDRFSATPEQFFYRLSNVLPQYFGIDQLFFYRFNHEAGQQIFKLTKEMHLSRTQGPSGFVDEHFCRRWVAITSLQELSILQKTENYTGPLCRAQLSTYADTGQLFLIITVAHAYRPEANENMSVSMCFPVNDALRSRMAFLESPTLPHRTVNEACERCGLFDCRERVAAPTVLQKRRQAEALKLAVEKIGG